MNDCSFDLKEIIQEAEESGQIPTLTRRQAAEIRGDTDVCMVDVRTPAEIRVTPGVPDALNVPVDDETCSSYTALSRAASMIIRGAGGRHVVIFFCASGERCRKAADVVGAELFDNGEIHSAAVQGGLPVS